MSVEEGRQLTEAYLSAQVRPRFRRALESERRRREVYLANHSLGRMPDLAAERVAAGLEHWLDPEAAWHSWSEVARQFRAATARLIGRSDASAVVTKTSAGQGLRAVLNSFPAGRPVRVVTTTEEFDSIDFVLRRYRDSGRAEVTWVAPTAVDGPVPLLEQGPVCEAVSESTDLVVLSHVYFTTGQVFPGLEETIRHAHSHAAIVVLDMYHSAGVIPLHFDDWSLDFAIGGSYKYLRGGPGACWLAVGASILEEERLTLDTGWFAREDAMAYPRGDDQRPARGGDSWLESTPPVLTPYQALPGLELVGELGVAAIRTHSLDILDRWRGALERRGVTVHRPASPGQFGAFALMEAEPGFDSTALARVGVVTDSRGGFVRSCPDILTSDEDIETAADRVAQLRA